MTEQMTPMSEEMALEELTTEKELRRRELEQAFGRPSGRLNCREQLYYTIYWGLLQ